MSVIGRGSRKMLISLSLWNDLIENTSKTYNISLQTMILRRLRYISYRKTTEQSKKNIT
ncbi:DUF4322 domain-containing protein [Saccharolobus shibatae]|uniref:DUF4322 domain-containing protein n=1 Tax=Saccharolobus shibatae TaxID=2286 RepID=A0A8F5BWC3_9CREN|nr:DUF4322 domain-containing protein [Saccharolobus shibatae]QXJ32659.1 hypothetical protein J5U21_02310 [Saccharolobus shibatae]QXJ35783.1 hypothetical protein J5U22_02330 [Saccharolobus shibatae]